MQSLKEARKQAREYMQNNHYGRSFISFTRQKGYYFTLAQDNYSVYFCRKNGALEELNTDYARRFFKCKNDWWKT